MKDKSSENKKKLNDEKNVIILAIAAGMTVIILTVVLAYLLCIRIVPKFEIKNLELGKPVPSHVYNYVTGLPFRHDGIEVDYSQIDNMTVGDYEVIVSGKLNFTCTIHVQDTTKPYIGLLSAEEDGTSVNNESGVYYSAADDCVILELGEVYNVVDLVSEISDASDQYSVEMTCDGNHLSLYNHMSGAMYNRDSFRTAECGDFVYEITASDASGNSSSAVINVRIVDTEGPEILMPQYEVYYATNTEYTVMDFAADIDDPSGVDSYCFVVNGIESDIISYTNIGAFNIAIKAIDSLGNESVTDIVANFDDAPVFVGVRDTIYIPVGKTFDFYQYFKAFDNTDGDISARMCVTCDELDFSVSGSYPYECWVADSHGLASVYNGNIIIGSEDSRDYVLTAAEIDILNQYDYFSYAPLEEGNYDAMVEMVKPTLVNLLRRYSDGGYSFGSGYIYKIDSDYIYVGTVDHVISDMLTTIEMRLCDDEETTVNVYVSGYERVSADSETAMFKIPVTSISAAVLLDLKQVYVDENIYEEIYMGQEIVAYSGHWSNNTPTIRKLYIKRFDEKFLDGAAHCIVTSHNTKGGMSGCPIFDLQGRLVALCEGYWGRFNYDIYAYEYEGYQQRIEGLGELYERVKELPYNEAG